VHLVKKKKKKKIQAKIKQKKKKKKKELTPGKKKKIEIDPWYNGFLDPPLITTDSLRNFFIFFP
jgi:hypothetical protein